MGFEVFLESERLVLVREGAVLDELPRPEFGCMGGSAGVVVRYPLFQIRGRSDVFLIRKIDAADDVDVPHRLSGPL